MTAPALNPAQSGPAGLNAAGGVANANANAASGALAGFEALMAALFPQAEAVAAPATPAAAPTAGSTPVVVDPLLVATTDAEATDGDDTADEAGVDAAATALAGEAMLPSVPAPVTDVPKTVAAETAAPDAPAPVAPEAPQFAASAAAPAPAEDETIRDGEPKAADSAPTEAPEAPPEVPSAPAKTELAKLSDSVARQAQPPAGGERKLDWTPTTPALGEPSAASASAKSAAPEAPVDAPEGAVAVAEEQAHAAAPPNLPTRAEAAPNSQTPGRSARTERGKAATETKAAPAAAPDAPPVETADAPTGPKASNAAARTAAQGPVEAAEARPDDAKPAADAPDFTIPSETRAGGTSSSAPATESAHPVRGAPETVANLAAQIIKKLDARTTRFDVELDPHGLGKVDVRVEIGANGRITAAMTFDNPQAAQDVKARANELQRALEQAGFDMQGGSLSFDVAQDRGQGGQGRAWQEQNETGATFRGQAFRAALETAGDAAQAANQGALRLSRGVRTGLDVRI
ncbi:MAG: hypothetical protein DI570_00600 [Phenylobacterium zucineum]|nr:MAG: hypothetical protein DI570_00600 [Phenylobacterium zucineum]